MRKLVLALATVVGLAGCASHPTAPTPSPQSEVATSVPVEISRSRVTTIARTVITGLEATAAAYILSGRPPMAERVAIARHEAVADSAVARLNAATDPALPAALMALSEAVDEFVEDLPPGRVPASVTAAVVALNTLIETIAPLIRVRPVIPGNPEMRQAVKVVA